MLPKTGNSFRSNHSVGVISSKYAHTVADALRKELGSTHQAIKTVMKWTGASERTAKNWLTGHTGPSGAYLLILVSKSDEVFMAALELAGRQEAIAPVGLNEIRRQLSQLIAQLDKLPGP